DVLPGGGELDSLSNHLLEPLLVGDDMVRGKHAYDGARIKPRKDECRQSNCRCGVSGHGLRDNLLLRYALELSADGFDHVFVGDDPKAIFRSQRQETQHSLRDHGLLAIKGEDLLGHAAAAARPESCAAAACQNHWIEGVFQFHQSNKFLYYARTVCNWCAGIVTGSGTVMVGIFARTHSSSHSGRMR